MQETFQHILSSFRTTSLKATNEQASLLERVDRKYLIPIDQADEIIASCSVNYDLLLINSTSKHSYKTTYYDTADFQFYREHHAGRLNRMKIRIREYLDSQERFLEMKFKSNKGICTKKRMPLLAESCPDKILKNDFPQLGMLLPADLYPALDICYKRITLVSKKAAERVTLDYDLIFKKENTTLLLKGFMIAEVKCEKKHPSFFAIKMKEKGIREVSISKYCLGVASMVEKAKTNRFKPLLNKIKTNKYVFIADSQ